MPLLYSLDASRLPLPLGEGWGEGLSNRGTPERNVTRAGMCPTGFLAALLDLVLLLDQNRVTGVPQLLRDYRLHMAEDPLGFRFGVPAASPPPWSLGWTR